MTERSLRTLATIFLVGALLALAVFVLRPDFKWTEWPSLLSLGIAAISMGFSACVALVGFRLRSEREKQEGAFELIRLFYDHRFVERLTVDFDIPQDKEMTHEDAVRWFMKNPDKAYDVVFILNTYTVMALEIKHQYADERILFELQRRPLAAILDALRPYLTGLRKNPNLGDLGKEAEELSQTWQNGKSIVTGKSI